MIYKRRNNQKTSPETKNPFRIRLKIKKKHKDFRISLNKWHKQALKNALMIKSIYLEASNN
jgi:hypothetical protein